MTTHVLRCGDFVRLGACWFNRNHVTGIGKPEVKQIRRSTPESVIITRFTEIPVRCDGTTVLAQVPGGTEAAGVEAHRQFVYEVIGHLEPTP